MPENPQPAPVCLGTWPAPVEPAPRLAAAAGLAADALWIKRDDLSGLGGGGNKVRKLQYTCARALAAGASTLVTSGAPQSNHARLTAAAAARLGLRAVLVLGGEQPAHSQGNLALDHLAGARLAWLPGATPERLRAHRGHLPRSHLHRARPGRSDRLRRGWAHRAQGPDRVPAHRGLPGLFGHPALPRLV